MRGVFANSLWFRGHAADGALRCFAMSEGYCIQCRMSSEQFKKCGLEGAEGVGDLSVA